MEENEERVQNDNNGVPNENEQSTVNEANKIENTEEKITENNGSLPEDENEQKEDDDLTVKKSKKLFFCNINRSSDLSDIFKVFRKYGQICDILILKDKNGHSLGRGFVEFVQELDAENALNTLNNALVDGLKISINFATPRVRKATDVEYKQDPEKLDEDMRRKDIRLRMKNENHSRMGPPQPIYHNAHHKRRPNRDNYGDYSRSQDQYDYISDYDPYGYDFDDREFENRRNRRERDRDYDRRYNDYQRDRDRGPDRDYMRDFDRDRDRDRIRDQDIYAHSHHPRQPPPPPVSYNQESSRRVVPNIQVMRGPYRSDVMPSNSMDSRGRPPPPYMRPRRPNDDYDFDYDYDHDRDHHNRRRRIQPISSQQPRHPAHMVRQGAQMAAPYSSSQVVYQSGVGRSNSSPSASGGAETVASSSGVMRSMPGRYQDDIRLQRNQPPPKQLQEDQQRGYWKDDNYDQRNYRRRDRI